MFAIAIRQLKLRPSWYFKKLMFLKKNEANFGLSHCFNQCYYSSLFSKVLTHSEKREIFVPIETIYEVVLDVDSYQEFVPWCTKSIVLSKSKSKAKAKLAVGFGPIQEHYNSVIIFSKPIYIKAVCTDGKIFNLLECTWKFKNGTSASSTLIWFDVIFEFRSLIYTTLARTFFDEVAIKMVAAFEERAQEKMKSSI